MEIDPYISAKCRWMSFAAILCVVLGHCVTGTGKWQYAVMAIFAQWHVPFFYMMSGAFLFYSLNRATVGRVLQKKITGVLVPYLIWCLLASVFTVRIPGPWYDVSRLFGVMTVFPVGNPHLWYLRCLFIFSLVTVVFWWIARPVCCRLVCLILVCCAYLAVFVAANKFSLPSLIGTPMSPFYFILGFALSQFVLGQRLKKNSVPSALLVLSVAIVLRGVWFRTGMQGVGEAVLRFMCVITEILAFWMGMDACCKDSIRFPKALNVVLFVYCFHGLVLFWVDHFSFGWIWRSSVWGIVVIWMGVVMASVLIANLVRRELPRVYAILTGNR